jgi:hypothetical protein
MIVYPSLLQHRTHLRESDKQECTEVLMMVAERCLGGAALVRVYGESTRSLVLSSLHPPLFSELSSVPISFSSRYAKNIDSILCLLGILRHRT